MIVWLALTFGVTMLVDGEQKNRSDNAYVNELAGNGIYEFFAAYRNNELITSGSIVCCRGTTRLRKFARS